jgi:hypothetical protein
MQPYQGNPFRQGAQDVYMSYCDDEDSDIVDTGYAADTGYTVDIEHATDTGYIVDIEHATDTGYTVDIEYATDTGYTVDIEHATDTGYAADTGHAVDTGYAVDIEYLNSDGTHPQDTQGYAFLYHSLSDMENIALSTPLYEDNGSSSRT